jgi:tRNA nucleotidyltransferase (CCA-adding enzyme)
MSLPLVRHIAEQARDAGGRVLVVGGWVRDRLLGHDTSDLDLEVYGLPADRVRAILETFGRVDTVGESFTVFKLGEIDVALPRRESKVGRGHRGFEVTGDPALSITDAARRRDFTVNAILWDPLDDAYFDPFGGRADLERRILRAVDPTTFGDDSLRVLRALQLAARFELAMEEETKSLCRAIPLDDLPAERVWGEIEKLLLKARRPSLGFRLARELDVVRRMFPELEALVGCEQEPDWHPEGDVWVHTLLVIDEARRLLDEARLDRPRQIAVMLGAVCHDFGKPLTTAFTEGRIRSRGHEEAGVAPATTFLARLNVHSFDGLDVRREVLGLVAHHLKPGMFGSSSMPVSDGAYRRLAQKVDLELLAFFARADCLGRTGDFDCSAVDRFLARARALGVEHEPPKPLLLGRHLLALGMSPGPGLGVVLRQIYERQLDGEISTVEEGIEAARRLIGTGSR